MIHIGAHVRRWLRLARSGLRVMGMELSERALVILGQSALHVPSLFLRYSGPPTSSSWPAAGNGESLPGLL
jgi:hypothetical protein